MAVLGVRGKVLAAGGATGAASGDREGGAMAVPDTAAPLHGTAEARGPQNTNGVCCALTLKRSSSRRCRGSHFFCRSS